MVITDQSILVTGGTGSFGRALVREILSNGGCRRLIIFSRDELKQLDMRREFDDPRISYIIGDIRDQQRLVGALEGVDLVIHAAALKQVPTAEENPYEAVQTNIIGAYNVIQAARVQRVGRVIALSTDKAVCPVNLYGGTKLCLEKLFLAEESSQRTKFAVVRYGNVAGSRGSVVPYFLKIRNTGKIPITDKRMTRFWISLNHSVAFVLRCIHRMHGGELFIPRIPSIRITDLATAIAPDCQQFVIGKRLGEKLHEILIPEDESVDVLSLSDSYIKLPKTAADLRKRYIESGEASHVPDRFCYASDTNNDWLDVEDLRKMLKDLHMLSAENSSQDTVPAGTFIPVN